MRDVLSSDATDPTAPELTILNAPPEFSNDRRPRLEFASSTYGADFEVELLRDMVGVKSVRVSGRHAVTGTIGEYVPGSDLVDGQYTVRVRAVAGGRESIAQEHSWTVDGTKPTPPLLFDARVTADAPHEIRVSWGESSDPDGSGVAGFEIYYDIGGVRIPDDKARSPGETYQFGNDVERRGDGPTGPVFVEGASTRSYTLSRLPACRQHFIQVVAVDRAGNRSEMSAEWELGTRTRSGGDGSFGSPIAFDPGIADPRAMLVIDLHGDRQPDLILVDGSDPRGTIAIVRGRGRDAAGSPAFDPPACVHLDFNVDMVLRSAQVADLDRDDIPDLVVGSQSSDRKRYSCDESNGATIESGHVAVLKGTGTDGHGTGSFLPDPARCLRVGHPYATCPRNLQYDAMFLAIRDFDRDGNLDVLVGAEPVHNSVEGHEFLNEARHFTLRGTGTGALFAPEIAEEFPWRNIGRVTGLLLADLNHDHHDDLISCDNLTASVRIWAKGEFPAAADNYPTFGQATALAAGDFDRDGIRDLVACTDEGLLTVHLGTGTGGRGDGGFAYPTLIPIGAGGGPVAIADFNADGIEDIAVASTQTSRVSILIGQGNEGRGDGTFADPRSYATGVSANSIAAADFNEDGIVDLAIAGSGSVVVLPGRGATGHVDDDADVAFRSDPTGTSDFFPLAEADFNADAIPDFVGFGTGSFVGVEIRAGVGTGGQGSGELLSSFGYRAGVIGLAVGDFDDDHIQDVVVNRGFGALWYMRGLGAAGRGNGLLEEPFRWGLRYFESTPPDEAEPDEQFQSVVVADLDADGIDDVAAVVPVFLGQGKYGNLVVVMHGQGARATDDRDVLVPDRVYFAGGHPRGLAVADFDRDSHLDLAVLDESGSVDLVLLDGTRDPSPPVPAPDANNPRRTEVDFPAPTTASVTHVLALGTIGRGMGIEAPDLNVDGRPDLVVLAGPADSIAVALASSSGAFGAVTRYRAEHETDRILDMRLGDVTGDGTVDLVALVVTDAGWFTVCFFRGERDAEGRPTGAFGSRTTAAELGSGAHDEFFQFRGLELADLDADGLTDILVGRHGGELHMLLASGEVVGE